MLAASLSGDRIMKCNIAAVGRDELLAAPERAAWNAECVCDSVFLVPLGKPHDGTPWGMLAIVGHVVGRGYILAGKGSDSIDWEMPDGVRLRTDVTYPGGVVHMWCPRVQFRIGPDTESMTIVLEPI
jgi:hypothetical protein